jgi:hypothetical protein
MPAALARAGAAARGEAERGAAALVLWLRRADIEGLGGELNAARVYVSSTLLERDPAGIAVPGGDLRAVHPYRLPGETDPALRRFRAWLKARRLALLDEQRQAEAWFACLAANDGLMHSGRFFVRDFMLDSLDHGQGLPAYLPIHARPSSGPGQRWLAKGGYVLPIEAGMVRTEKAVWRVP